MLHRRSLIQRTAAAFLVLAAPVVPAAAQQAATDNLEISGGFARATAPMAQVGAGFLTIRSRGEADRLIGYTTPACNRPELHTHIDNNGVMQMRQVDGIDVPAGGEVVLAPGGFHMMMIDLTRPLVEGETVPITLRFARAGEVAVDIPVLGLGAMGPDDS